MDELGEPALESVDFFRCVLGPEHKVESKDEESVSQAIPSKSRMLAVSSRFGCVLVALRSTISVYNLPSVRKPSPATPRAQIALPYHTSAVAIQLVRSDEFLIVQVQESSGAATSDLLLLNVRYILAGKLKLVNFLPTNRCKIRSFTAYSSPATCGGVVRDSDQNIHLLAALTKEREIEVFDISHGLGVMLWSESRGGLQSQVPVCAAFNEGGKMLAIGTMRGSVLIFDSFAGKERSTIKEVESGWMPISLAFVANDSLLVCYQNESKGLLSHVVRHLDNHAPTTCSVLGDVFPVNLSDLEPGESDVTMLCEPVNTWPVFLLGNSMSSKIEPVGRVDDGTWTVWELDEGKEAELPLPSDPTLESFPLGMAIDYTDTEQIESLVPAEPKRNPMPRLLVLTSDEVLLSYLLVDDRPGAKCDAVFDVVPDTADYPTSPEHALLKIFPAAAQHEPVVTEPPAVIPNASFPAERDVLKGTQIPGILTQSADTSQEEPEQQKTVEIGLTRITISGEPAEAELKKSIFASDSFQPITQSEDFLGAFAFPGLTEDDNEVLPEATHQHQRGENIVANNTLHEELAKSESQVQRFGAPELSSSIKAAEDDDPVLQLTSILLEMEEELRCASGIGKATSALVENVRQEIESNLNEAQVRLSSLLDTARHCFKNQTSTREEVNGILQKVIENGHSFEDLSLLASLLTDQNDSRPLPRDIVEIDKSLTRKEAEIVNSLNHIEDKLEEPIDNTRVGRRKWNTHSEVTQHIYSSLSLQSIRIKRVKAMLNAFSKQIENSSLSRNEQRVTDLGLSLSRLERLSLASNSPFRRPETTPKQNKEDLETHANFEARESDGVGVLEEKEEAESSAVTGESASVLRRLAMRKGRAMICVSPLGPVSNLVSNPPPGSAPVEDPNAMASWTRAPVPRIGESNGAVGMALQPTDQHTNVQHANDPAPQKNSLWGPSKNNVFEMNKLEDQLPKPVKVSLSSNPTLSSTARDLSRDPTSTTSVALPPTSDTDNGTRKGKASSGGPTSSSPSAFIAPLLNSGKGERKVEGPAVGPTSVLPVTPEAPVHSGSGTRKEETSANEAASHTPFAPMPPSSDSEEVVQKVERSTDGRASLTPSAPLKAVSDPDSEAENQPASHVPLANMPPDSAGKMGSDEEEPRPTLAPVPPVSDNQFEALTLDSDAKPESERKTDEASKGDRLQTGQSPTPDAKIENEGNSSVVGPKNTDMTSISTTSDIPPKRAETLRYRNGAMTDSDSSSDDGTSKDIPVKSNQSAEFRNSGPRAFFAQPQNIEVWGPVGTSRQRHQFGPSETQQGPLLGPSAASPFGNTSSFGAAHGGMQDVAASSAASFMSTPTPLFGTPSKLGLQSTFGAPSAIGGSAPPASLGSPFRGSQGQHAPLFGAQSGTASGFATIARSGAGFGGGGFGGGGFGGGAFGASNMQGFGGQSGGSPLNQVGFGPAASLFGASTQSQSGLQGIQGSGFGSVAGSEFGQSDQQQSNVLKSAAFTQRRA